MMTRLFNTLRDVRGPAATLFLPTMAAVVMLASGCETTGDCVQVYEFEGTVVKSGYTRAECEAECSQIGRTLSCTFEGRAASPLAAPDRIELRS